MTKREWRATWYGAGIAVIGSILFAVIAHALEPTINGPGSRTLAPPVLWGLGGGFGLALGAFVASFGTRRFWPGAQAALFGALAFLVLVIIAYNDKTLRLEDQLVGSLLIVVVPAFLAGLLAAVVGKFAGRAFTRSNAAQPSGPRDCHAPARLSAASRHLRLSRHPARVALRRGTIAGMVLVITMPAVRAVIALAPTMIHTEP